MNCTSLVLCKKIKAYCPSAETCEVFTFVKENSNFLIPVHPPSSVISNRSLQAQSKRGLKGGCKGKGLRGEFGWVVCPHRGTLGSKRSTGWEGTACSTLSNLPVAWHTQCLPDRTCHSPCLLSSASHHTGWKQSPSLQTACVRQIMKSPFGIPSALDSLVHMAGWPEALPGCPSPGSHGRSYFPALLLPHPDPLALPSPLVASDHKRTVSFNPPA